MWPITGELADTAEPLRVEASVEREIAALEERQRIAFLLHLLPDTLRLPLVMCDVDGLS